MKVKIDNGCQYLDITKTCNYVICKYHKDDYGFHFCTKQGVYCPDDSEYFCAYGDYLTNGFDAYD